MNKMKLLFCCLAMVVLFSLSACSTKYVHVGPNWDSIHSLKASEKTFAVHAQGTTTAALGEVVKFSVRSEKSGRLWVVKVDPDDDIALLFPNAVSGSNWIDAGQQLTVPPAGEDWDIVAAEPTGFSTVAFIVTDQDTDLGDVFNEQDATMNKAFAFLKTRSSWGIDHIVVAIK